MDILIKVIPNSSANSIEGLVQDAIGQSMLKIKVTSPPENGKANENVLKLLAEQCNIPKSSITIVRGETSKIKTISCNDDILKILGFT